MIRSGARGTLSALGLATSLAIGLAAGIAPAPAVAEEVFFKCHFDWDCDPNRKCTDADLNLGFHVDTETNSVSKVGGDPTSTFSLILGDRGVTILETMLSGGTATTTVSIMGGDAVHSTQPFDGMDLAPHQYLGECVTL